MGSNDSQQQPVELLFEDEVYDSASKVKGVGWKKELGVWEK